MKINVFRFLFDEESVLSGPSFSEIKNYQISKNEEHLKEFGKKDPAIKQNTDYFITDKKYHQLEDFLDSSGYRTRGLRINPLFSVDDMENIRHSKKISKIKIKEKGKYVGFLSEEDLIDHICKKNKIASGDLSIESLNEIKEMTKKYNLGLKNIYFKDLILEIINPAISRVVMEDFFTQEERNKILNKPGKILKYGPSGLEHSFQYDKSLDRGDSHIHFDHLISNTTFSSIDSGNEKIISPMNLDFSKIPFHRDLFFVGYYGKCPGASIMNIDRDEKKILVYINEQILKSSSLNLDGEDYGFFISIADEILNGKICLEINDWKVEISNIDLDSFMLRVKQAKGKIKKSQTYENIESSLLNSMFATSNYAFNNATPESFKGIEKIREEIIKTFNFDSKVNKKTYTNPVEGKMAKYGLSKWWESEFTPGEKQQIENKNLSLNYTESNPTDAYSFLVRICSSLAKNGEFLLIEKVLKKIEDLIDKKISSNPKKKELILFDFYLDCITLFKKGGKDTLFFGKTKEYCYKSIEISKEVYDQKNEESMEYHNEYKKIKEEYPDIFTEPLIYVHHRMIHPGYAQICIILEKEKKYSEALELISKAKAQGWHIDKDEAKELRIREKII